MPRIRGSRRTIAGARRHRPAGGRDRRRGGPRSRGGFEYRSYRDSRRDGRPSSTSITARGHGRPDAAVARRPRRRPRRAPGRDPGGPGRRVPTRAPPGGPRRRRGRHPGHLPPGVARLARVPGRFERAHVAARHRPTSVRRWRPAFDSAATVVGPRPVRSGTCERERGRARRGTGVLGAGPRRRPRRRPARRLRPHSGDRLLLRRGGDRLPGSDRHHPLASRPRTRATGDRGRRRGGRVIAGIVRRGAVMSLAAGVVGAATLLLTASPASAHGVGGVQPRNYRTTLLRVAPPVAGVRLAVVDLGDNLQLSNETRHDVVVLGYDDEPYLRVGPRGVFENTRSPATYLNRSRIPTSAPPKSADASAAPVWHKISSGTAATWHDHRAHFMGGDDPPEVRRAPSTRHLVDRWTVELRTGRRLVRATGELVYVPPPSPWPYVGVALAIAVALVALSRTRWWRAALTIGLSTLVASDLAHVVGLWNATTASTGAKWVETAYSLVGIALGVLALAWMARRGADAAMPLYLVASIFLFFAGGLADVSTIGHSQIPTTFAATPARLLVVFDLGLGAGVAVGAALRLRPAARPRATHSP